MATREARWVLGHQVARVDTLEDYAMLHITTPAHTPGPPPHYHDDASELFLIVRGRMTVVCDGARRVLSAGESFVVPKGGVHTFANETGDEVEWVTSFRPSGFQEFFTDFGVPVHEPDARARSVSGEMIEQVMAQCERYGMILAEMPAPMT